MSDSGGDSAGKSARSVAEIVAEVARLACYFARTISLEVIEGVVASEVDRHANPRNRTFVPVPCGAPG